MFRITWNEDEALRPGLSNDITIADPSTGGFPRISFAMSDKLIQMAQTQSKDEQDSGLLDDCENLFLLGGTWTLGNGATVGNTTIHHEGEKAIFVKGGATDYPYVEVEFAGAQDWSRFKKIDLMLAPLNDDETPALGKTVRVTIFDADGDSIYFNKTLAGTADQWRQKVCQLNDSNEGDSKDGGDGTFDSSKVKKLRITGYWIDDNLDLAFDRIQYFGTRGVMSAPIVTSYYLRQLKITLNGQVFVKNGTDNPWEDVHGLLRHLMWAKQATLYVYPEGQDPAPKDTESFEYSGCYRGEVESATLTATENEQKFDVVIVFAVGKDPAIVKEEIV